MRQFGKSNKAARTHQCPHNQKHGRNGPRGRIGQNRKRHVIGQNPADEQNSNAKNRDHLSGEAFAQKQQKHHGNHPKRDERLALISQNEVFHFEGPLNSG